ncbi:hypothetical protein [uncultured Mediterranean phage uvMED]|nr:hypothetical protein [uncultured Mediterranean phage uvMED]BAR24554.1 hypothetical protein [uncultured Mediterranean phage uvMED]
MANTYTWKVGQCDRTLADGVITTLHYTVTAVTEDEVYSAGAYGSIGLEAPEAESMIAYDSVTEANCIAWVQAAIGGAEKVTEIQTALDNQLTEKRTPTVGAGTPWSA